MRVKARVLFDDLPSKETLIWQIREMQENLYQRKERTSILIRKNYWTLVEQHSQLGERYAKQSLKEANYA